MTTSTLSRTAKTQTAHAAEGVSFTLALDSGSYVVRDGAPGKLTATLTLRCPKDAPLTLDFAGGQEFEIAIDDAAGDQIALWSAGQKFFDHVQTLTVEGERRWTATMALPRPPIAFPPAKPGGALFAASSYTATAFLMTIAPAAAATGPSGGMHPGVAHSNVAPSVIGGTAAAPSRPVVSPRPYSATVAFTVHSDPVILEGAAKTKT